MFRPQFAGQIPSLGYLIGRLIEDDLGLTLTNEQIRRVVELYRIDPVSGRRLVRRAALRRPKGAGKSPEGAMFAYAELVLPVVFSQWDTTGQPIARRHHDPWIQLAALSEDQTDNVMVWLYDVLSNRPHVLADRNIDLGRSRIYLTDGPGRIEPVTAAAGSREGQRVTFAVLDQTESWTRENGGRKLAAVLRRNAAKMTGWTYELQNAPEAGDGSVADDTARDAEKQAAGVWFDTREGPEVPNLRDKDALIHALHLAYGEATLWVDVERLAEEIMDPGTDPSDARRYYLNQPASRADRAFDRKQWMTLAVPDAHIADGALVVLGFDGSRFDDATALIAVDVVTNVAELIGLWEHDGTEDWQVNEAEVTATVRHAFERFDVWRLYADPPYWEPTVAAWRAEFGSDRVVEWWTTRPRAVGYACRNLAVSIRAADIKHDGNPDLARHLGNAIKRRVNSRDEEGAALWTVAKESPSRKIDAAMALVLGWEARNDAIASGAVAKRRRGRFLSFSG